MHPAIRRELAARRGECYVALREPDPELLEALGDRARVIRPVYGAGGPGRVTLEVPGAAISGDRAYIEDRLVLEGETVEQGVYGRTAVLEPLKASLERLWRTGVEPGDLPGWEARREAAAAYAEYRFGETEAGGLRSEFASAYGESAPDLSDAERELWSHVEPRGLAAFVDALEPEALRTDLGDLVPGPRGFRLPEPSTDLVEELRGADPDVLGRGVEAVGGISRKLTGDSVAEGLVLVVSSLLVPRPRRDTLFVAGAATVAELID